MAATTVYACDWCKTDIPKDQQGEPVFAAKVLIKPLRTAVAREPKTDHICTRCLSAAKALTEGRYRR